VSRRHVSEETLVALASGETPRKASEHVKECEVCRERLRWWQDHLEAVRELVPPPISEPDRMRQINRALASLDEQSARKPARKPVRKPAWRWAVPAFAAATVIAVVVAVSLGRESGPVFPVVETGSLVASGKPLEQGASLPSGVDLVSQRVARFRLDEGTTVHVHPSTRLSLPSPGTIALEEGTVRLAVAPREERPPIRVHSAEAHVVVVGTELVVARAASTQTTTIRVERGVVEVSDRLRSEKHTLRGGEALSVTGVLAPRAKPSASASGAPPASSSSAVPAKPRPVRIRDIRDRIRAGQSAEAMTMIRRARSSGGVNAAELAIVEAEALLAMGQGGRAVRAYLDVTKRYPGTPQAESALFAAAQLSVDYSGKSRRGQNLLRQYLATYPNGRFRADASRLLEALEERADAAGR